MHTRFPLALHSHPTVAHDERVYTKTELNNLYFLHVGIADAQTVSKLASPIHSI
jgi:hypothetical protein